MPFSDYNARLTLLSIIRPTIHYDQPERRSGMLVVPSHGQSPPPRLQRKTNTTVKPTKRACHHQLKILHQFKVLITTLESKAQHQNASQTRMPRVRRNDPRPKNITTIAINTTRMMNIYRALSTRPAGSREPLRSTRTKRRLRSDEGSADFANHKILLSHRGPNIQSTWTILWKRLYSIWRE